MARPLVPQRINIPIGGGLLQNETPEYLDPPALFECENMYHKQRTGLTKRPGYNCNQICVDARAATVTSWLASVNTPLLDTPLDRFLNTESGATFAARGWLWSFMGDLFLGCTGVTPVPNAVKHCEIPDLHMDADITFSIVSAQQADLGRQVLDAASSTHVTDLECSTFLIYELPSYYEWRVRLTCRSTGVLIAEKVLLKTFAETWEHVCCVAFTTGFVVTCYNVTEARIMCFRYTIADAEFTSQVFPALTLHDPEGWGTAAPAPRWYDLCGTGTDDFHIGWIVSSGSYIPNIHVGGGDVSVNFLNGLFAATIDAATLTVKYGGYYMGDDAARQVGCTTWAPMFAVAGDETGNYAVAWIDHVAGAVAMRAVYQQTKWISVRVVVTSLGTTGRQVGIGFVKPTKQVNVMWNVIWEYTDLGLIAGGNYLTSVKSRTIGSDKALDFVERDYWASHIVTNPWTSLGNSYAVLATSQPMLMNGSLPSGGNYADQPYVLVRTWSDQDTNEADAEYKNYQKPMAVWGYGQVKLPMQPLRILWDPESSTSAAKVKASGSIVLSDPFLQGNGVSVQRLEFDPTSHDRYSSAALPGGGSIFGCANPWIFDGDTAFEATFVHRPWFISYAVAAGGLLIDDTTVADSSHYLQLIYEHMDAKGRVTRSPVSTMVAVATTGASQKITLTVIPPFWSARKPGTTVLKIYMCRDGLSFQWVGTVPVQVWWVGSMPTYLSWEIGSEPNPDSPYIYTYNGTIESGYGQLAAHIERWDNRIWLANKNTIGYSQEFIDGDGPSFPDSFTEYVDTEVTGIMHFDDRILLFNMDAIAYRNGEGPHANGQASNYSKWNYFTHDIGCVNPRSLVRTQIGAFFQSRRHIEFLDTSCKITHQLAVETIFSSVSDMSSGPVILGGLSLPKSHQVRLLYCNQTTGIIKQLVIDYETMTWSHWYGAYSWTGYFRQFFGDIGVDGDNVYVIDGNGNIFSEVEYSFIDTDIPVAAVATRRHIDWSVKTPWIKIDGLQGVQMVWNSMVMFRTAEWTEPAIAQVPAFGITVNVDVDYQNNMELHGFKSIEELKDLREPSGITYLQVGHVNPICSAYQIQLSSSDSTDYDYLAPVTGVYGIVGLWSELAVEPGTGRKRAESRM